VSVQYYMMCGVNGHEPVDLGFELV